MTLLASDPGLDRVFLILNPGSGTYAEGDLGAFFEGLRERFGSRCELHRLAAGEDLTQLAWSAAEAGFGLIVAAGGDGTVSAVANGLVGNRARLGIIPLGTANVLAGELGVPIDAGQAAELLSSSHRTVSVDALEINGRHYFTQVGVGLDALMIRDTDRESKKRFGRLAYLWMGFVRVLGFQPRRFLVEVDGRRSTARALQVLIANCGTMGQRPLQWGPGILPDDGRVNVCIIRAQNLWDYVVVGWQLLTGSQRDRRYIRDLVAEQTVGIDSPRPLPVQADGEIIGETPVRVRVAPSVIRVVVPESERGIGKA